MATLISSSSSSLKLFRIGLKVWCGLAAYGILMVVLRVTFGMVVESRFPKGVLVCVGLKVLKVGVAGLELVDVIMDEMSVCFQNSSMSSCTIWVLVNLRHMIQR